MAAETREFKDIYREADAEERFTLMMDNYNAFPKIIRKMERKTKYRIVTEHERMRSAHRDELGVRIQTSGLSDPTAAEAEADRRGDLPHPCAGERSRRSGQYRLAEGPGVLSGK